MVDIVVTDAERARREVADDPDGDRADRGPPHPVHRQVLERVLDRVHRARDEHGRDADDGAEDHVGGERDAVRLQQIGHRERRRRAAETDAHARRRRRGERHRNERTRAELEQQKLHCEEHRRDRAAECRRHSRGRAGGEERLAFRRGGAQHLADQRPERAARRDDRSFRAERSARSDRDRGGDRLEQRDASRNAAAVQQDLLHRLGNSVAADRGRSVPGHQPDDDAAQHGNQHHPTAELVRCGRHVFSAEPSIERDVRDEPDQPRQDLGDRASRHGDDDRQGADEHDATVDEHALRRHPGRRERGREGRSNGQRVRRCTADDIVDLHSASSSRSHALSSNKDPGTPCVSDERRDYVWCPQNG